MKCIPPLTIIRFPQKVFINHVHAIDMIKIPYFTTVLFIGTLTSFLTYPISGVLSASPLIMEESNAQPEGGSLNPESQDRESPGQQIREAGPSSNQCPPNQHNIGSTNECEWDNCGLSTPPMYRNTQSGRCVSDCSLVGQLWVEQGNTCVLNDAVNATSTQSPPSGGPIPSQGENKENGTSQTRTTSQLSSENVTKSASTSNLSSAPTTTTETIASLAGEPALPYACFSNTFTCYCDGTEDCTQLTSSGECKAEVRTVEGKPGLGECDWSTKS
jgi:hypothetical protein